MMAGHYSALMNTKSTYNTFKKPFVHVKKQDQKRRAQTAAKRPITAVTKTAGQAQNENWLNKLANEFEY
jgi:hypothetical protein